jgi:hypothetical protein
VLIDVDRDDCKELKAKMEHIAHEAGMTTKSAKAGYHQGGLAKIQAARDISAYMQPERNRSRSFQTFRQGVISLLSE